MAKGIGKFALTIMVSLLLFFVFQWASVYRDFSYLEAQRYELEGMLNDRRKSIERYQADLVLKDREVAQLEERLKNSHLSGKRSRTRLKAYEYSDTSTIFVVTPTYQRLTQLADLTRLAQTLVIVPNVVWLLVEDAEQRTDRIARFLEKSKVMYRHLNALTPPSFKLNASDPHWSKPRGVEQRNAALKWIRRNLSSKLQKPEPIVYFADDDNTYDVALFEEMRFTNGVSVWPVAFSGALMVERPIVRDGKVVDFLTAWKPDRPFPMDMAGFAINARLLVEHPLATFSWDVARGFQESHLLSQLISREDLEPKADGCTKVLVWHTRTEVPKLKQEKLWNLQGKRSDEGMQV